MGWRVWFAFELRPGITMSSSRDMSSHWRGLAEACRDADGKIDSMEFGHWLNVMVEHLHLSGTS